MRNGECQCEKVKMGAVEMVLAGGEVRYVRVGGVEVLRRIYVAVRDGSWETVPGTLAGYCCEKRAEGFRVGYRCEHREGQIDFAWEAAIEGQVRESGGEVEAEISFVMEGAARSTFMTNRTGICVLHPIAECAGKVCEIEHSDGRREVGEFPKLIAAHQPFTDIRAMVYEPGRQETGEVHGLVARATADVVELPAEALTVEVRFDGEVFETEDQRNWTDGSYKTYCRPLARGFPYELKKGERVRQSVVVRVRGKVVQQEKRANAIRVGGEVGALPQIGVCWIDRRLGETGLDRLRDLNLSHLHSDMCCGPEGIKSTLASAVDAGKAGLPLQAALHLPEGDAGADARRLIMRLSAALEVMRSQVRGPEPARCIVYRDRRPFVSPDDLALVSRLRCELRVPEPQQEQAIAFGGGTVGNFAELNRNRPPEGSMAVLAWPINPQVHATDDLSLVENLQGQGDTVRTARAFAPGAHLAVGPIILHRQADPFAGGKSGAVEQASEGDPRQKTAFGAAWTLGSIKQLAEAGADSLTYYEMKGPFGVMGADGVYPLYRVLKAVGEMKGAKVLKCTSSDAMAFESLAMRKGDRLRVMVACLRDEAVEATVAGLPDGERLVKLGAYEVVILDYEGDRRL